MQIKIHGFSCLLLLVVSSPKLVQKSEPHMWRHRHAPTHAHHHIPIWAFGLRQRKKEQSSFFPSAHERAQHRSRAYKYPPQASEVPACPEHDTRTPPPGTTTNRPIEAGRQSMDGQGNSGSAGAGDCDAVARAFVDYYYRTFDASRAALAVLYGQTSMLSFEGHAVAGAEEIGRKLAQLPLEQCRHAVCTLDSQPSPSFPGSVLVFVSGTLQLAGEEHQLRFSQVARRTHAISARQ